MFRLLLARLYFMWGSLHRNFGNRSSFQREHRHAIRRFTQAIELDPHLREARLSRGIILFREMGRLDQALADFDALLEEDAHYGPALLNRALLAQEQGRYATALHDLDRYLALPAEDGEYYRMAARTAEVLREIVAELDDNQGPAA
ncbi:MAG: tetratricopeptide repeat protein [Candidatus Promineifilaceae bacterium]|nr:tetratricopeptide repeat protein [Candidatus Promineifilaceae bacterium]